MDGYHKCAATDAAVDVIDRSRKKQAGVSWHEISPVRGRNGRFNSATLETQQVWKCVRDTDRKCVRSAHLTMQQ